MMPRLWRMRSPASSSADRAKRRRQDEDRSQAERRRGGGERCRVPEGPIGPWRKRLPELAQGSDTAMAETRSTQLLVIGAGPGGYPAALHAADRGLTVTLVDEDNRLGGVCLNRGCIPSKALLHIARLIHEVRALAEQGVRFEGPQIDLDCLRSYVQKQVVGRLNNGIAQLTKARGVQVLTGQAAFLDPHTVR
ncbi:MAG: FAD-dependent oxidoreductase, partial [Syntrophobacterales bacterium]|nr:FAD-dependent oxidoreductase [Syntrophobacterales bacterium]